MIKIHEPLNTYQDELNYFTLPRSADVAGACHAFASACHYRCCHAIASARHCSQRQLALLLFLSQKEPRICSSQVPRRSKSLSTAVRAPPVQQPKSLPRRRPYLPKTVCRGRLRWKCHAMLVRPTPNFTVGLRALGGVGGSQMSATQQC